MTLSASIDVDAKPGATGNYVSASCSFAVEVLNHAHPVKMRRDPRWSDASIKIGRVVDNGTPILKLLFKYVWDSTGGKVAVADLPFSDLGQCWVHEYVTWSGNGHNGTDPDAPAKPVFWFDPPFAYSFIANPTITPARSGNGNQTNEFSDAFFYAIPANGSYRFAKVTGTQSYLFHCDQLLPDGKKCMQDEEEQKLLGPFTIDVVIENIIPTTNWQMRLSRDGITTTTPL